MRIIGRAPLAAQVNANVTTAQIFPNSLTLTVPTILTVHGTGVFEQKKFMVRASGYVTTHANTNVTVTLYSGTSLTPGSNTVLKASTATAQDGSGGKLTRPFYMEGELIFDSVSGYLNGIVGFVINNALVAKAAITELGSLSGTNEPVLNLCVGVTFSAANVDNLANLAEFIVGF